MISPRKKPKSVLSAWARSNSTGSAVHVDNVSRGLASNTVCFACGEPMVAKQGDILAYHFSHHGDSDCHGSPGESFLHLIAKEAIAERLRKQGYSDVELEPLYTDSPGYRADVSGIKCRKEYFEVVVTNPMSDEKLAWVRTYELDPGFHVVRVDLRSVYKRLGDNVFMISAKELNNVILENSFPLVSEMFDAYNQLQFDGEVSEIPIAKRKVTANARRIAIYNSIMTGFDNRKWYCLRTRVFFTGTVHLPLAVSALDNLPGQGMVKKIDPGIMSMLPVDFESRSGADLLTQTMNTWHKNYLLKDSLWSWVAVLTVIDPEATVAFFQRIHDGELAACKSAVEGTSGIGIQASPVPRREAISDEAGQCIP